MRKIAIWFLSTALALPVARRAAADEFAREPAREPVVFTFHAADLALVKQRIAADDQATVVAKQMLVRKAQGKLRSGPFSVVLNEGTPPSGDKHDYLSQAPYWWPDPKQPDGKPYIRRDGRVNPDSEGRDDAELEQLSETAWQLSFAWHLTGDRRYAERAAYLLRVWFFDPETRMKPRLPFGQFVPGHNNGRGAGLIESRRLLLVLDTAGLLEGSPAWTADDRRQLQAWFREFLDWMHDSSRGEDERAADNNHGTWYDAQAAAYALFVGDESRARKILDRAKKKRFIEAFDRRGRPVYEIDRTKSLDYSLFNLEALMQLALLGERVDLHLWKARFDDGRGLPKNVEWLAPYAAGAKPWPYQQIDPPSPDKICILYRRAAVALGCDDYEQISQTRRDGEADHVTIALELVHPRR